VRCVVEHRGSILLIRHTYGDRRWRFPGGGVRRGETPEQAALREVKEEVGVGLRRVEMVGAYASRETGARDQVSCFRGEAAGPEFDIHRGEVREAGWFPADNPPADISPDARRVLELYRRAAGEGLR
jgi:ADP-ribose pyrophosphatase YjhB (NUDIX family)